MKTYRDEIANSLGTTVVRACELQRLGMRTSTITRRCRPLGPWQRLLPGVLILHNGPVQRDERRRAALLYAGPGSVLTGLDALALHGMERMPHPSGAVHVLVPADRRRTGAGHVLIERTDRLPEPGPGRWPLASQTRAALDASRRVRARNEVRAVLAEVVQRGRSTPAQLWQELAQGNQRGSALPRLVLEEIADGVRSVAEAQARELLRRSGLPAPLWNPRLLDHQGREVATPDAWFDDVAMAWEIDSISWHLGPDDYARTVDRRSAMMAAGVVVLHTLPQKIQERGPEVLAELQGTYKAAASRPRPPLRTLKAR